MQVEIKYFKNIDNFDNLRAVYKDYVKQYHPDINLDCGDILKYINAEYDFLVKDLSRLQSKTVDTELEASLKEIIENLVRFDIGIEICGSWLWLHDGLVTTKSIKTELKALGCWWSPKKSLWYWHSPESKRRRSGNYTLEEIRAKYGSQSFKSKQKARIAA